MRIRIDYAVRSQETSAPYPVASVSVAGVSLRTFGPPSIQEGGLDAPDYATVVGREARAFAAEMRRMVRARWKAYARVLGLRGMCRYLILPFISRWRALTILLSLVTLVVAVAWVGGGWSSGAWIFTAVLTFVAALAAFLIDALVEWTPTPRVLVYPQRVDRWQGRDLRTFPALRAELRVAKETTRATTDPDLDLLLEGAMEQYAGSALRNLLPEIREFEDSVKMQRQMHRFLRAGG